MNKLMVLVFSVLLINQSKPWIYGDCSGTYYVKDSKDPTTLHGMWHESVGRDLHLSNDESWCGLCCKEVKNRLKLIPGFFKVYAVWPTGGQKEPKKYYDCFCSNDGNRCGE